MYELKKIGKVFTSKFVGTGPSSYEKGIYRPAVSQRLRNTALINPPDVTAFIQKGATCLVTISYHGAVLQYLNEGKI